MANQMVFETKRYHGIEISESSVYRILVKHGVNRLSKQASKRTVHTKRYSKQVPGHHVQIDVKFVTLKSEKGSVVRRFLGVFNIQQ
jgi:arginine/lysine/ornithine decarboxylase